MILTLTILIVPGRSQAAPQQFSFREDVSRCIITGVLQIWAHAAPHAHMLWSPREGLHNMAGRDPVAAKICKTPDVIQKTDATLAHWRISWSSTNSVRLMQHCVASDDLAEGELNPPTYYGEQKIG